MAPASDGLTAAFLATVLAVAVLAIAAHGTRGAALAVGGWLAFTAALAAGGALRFEPPTIIGLFALMIAVVSVAALRAPGARILQRVPLVWLIAYQAFRIPVELILHRAWVEGIIPVQMTYAGWNFDILTGVGALVVAALYGAGFAGRRTIMVWNVAGLALLVNIVTIALLSTPSPLRMFTNEPANEWVRHAPWVWLPTVLVAAALFGHLLVFRALGGAGSMAIDVHRARG